MMQEQRRQFEARDQERGAELEYNHRYLVLNLYESMERPLAVAKRTGIYVICE